MSQNSPQNQNLQAAMNVFWQHGYEGTSFNQLVTVTGLSRKAIYKNWQDKHGLFTSCLSFYSQYMAQQMLAPLTAETTGLPAIKGFFSNFQQLLTSESNLHGCLIVKTVGEMGTQDAEISAITHEFLLQVKNALYNALNIAQQTGQISQNANIAQAVEFLFAIHTSFGSLSGAPNARPLLTAMITQALAYLDQLETQ